MGPKDCTETSVKNYHYMLRERVVISYWRFGATYVPWPSGPLTTKDGTDVSGQPICPMVPWPLKMRLTFRVKLLVPPPLGPLTPEDVTDRLYRNVGKKWVLAVSYWCFGTTYWSHDSLVPWPLKMGPRDCTETSVINYHYMLRQRVVVISYWCFGTTYRFHNPWRWDWRFGATYLSQDHLVPWPLKMRLTFRVNLLVPRPLGPLTPEDGTDRMCRNIGKKLPLLAA